MAETLGQKLRRVIDQSLAPLLRADGFSAHPARNVHPFYSAVYLLRSSDMERFVGVWRDKYWTKKIGKFTIDIAIAFPSILASSSDNDLYGVSVLDWPAVDDRLPRLKHGKDYWFTVKPKSNEQELCADLVVLWGEFGRPWFERLSDPVSCRDYLVEESRCFIASKLSLALKDNIKARKLLAYALAGRAAESAVDWGVKHELIDSSDAIILKHALLQDQERLLYDVARVFGMKTDTLAKGIGDRWSM